jgi:PD-(D/E)XK nuclease superfamily
VTSARERLAALAAAAAYPDSAVTLLAEATLPRHTAGEPLSESECAQLADAIEVLAQAGRTSDTLALLIADYRQRRGEDWRERFWARTLRTASLRYAHPERYGLSPCETDPARLAQHRAASPASRRAPYRASATANGRRSTMPHLTLLAADSQAAANGAATAAELAGRIRLPRELPTRYDGQPLRHLSHSSVTKFWLCPDLWRRYYLRGERFAPTGAMFLGSRVDDALTHYYRHRLETGEQLPLQEVERFFGRNWKRQLEAENDKLGVACDERLDRPTALKLGVRALALASEQLVPRLGEPVAVQRRVELRLGEVEWTVEGYLDLETRRHEPGSEEPVEEVVDYKVKAGSAITEAAAARNPQASLYLAARWLEGRPARFQFAQTLIPGAQRKTMTTSLIPAERTTGELRATLARIALTAAQIATAYERFGADGPWQWADPSSWKCSPRYCEHWRGCPGGAGL